MRKKVQCQTVDTYTVESRANSHFSIRISTLNKHTVLTSRPKIRSSVLISETVGVLVLAQNSGNITHTVSDQRELYLYPSNTHLFAVPSMANHAHSTALFQFNVLIYRHKLCAEVECKTRDICRTMETESKATKQQLTSTREWILRRCNYSSFEVQRMNLVHVICSLFNAKAEFKRCFSIRIQREQLICL